MSALFKSCWKNSYNSLKIIIYCEYKRCDCKSMCNGTLLVLSGRLANER